MENLWYLRLLWRAIKIYSIYAASESVPHYTILLWHPSSTIETNVRLAIHHFLHDRTQQTSIISESKEKKHRCLQYLSI